MRVLTLCFLLFALTLGHTPSLEAQQSRASGAQVTTRVLADFTGLAGVEVVDLNNRGQIIGLIAGSPFIWSRSAGIQIIPGVTGRATGISSAGAVVGVSSTDRSGWLWTQRVGVTSLGTLVPHAVNSQNQVAGFCPAGDELWACVWDRGVVTLITRGIASDIADNGLVTGQAYDGMAGDAFRWSASRGLELLERPGGLPDDGPYGPLVGNSGVAINSAGRVVGWAGDSWDNLHPAEWTRSKVSYVGADGVGIDVNARGESLIAPYMATDPYVKGAKGEVAVLSGFIVVAINDAGEILGQRWRDDGYEVVILRVKHLK